MTLAEQAHRLYELKWKSGFEQSDRNRFVAIEPVSESCYLGDAFIDAALAAKRAFPDRQSFVIRIGHEAAFHLGACSQ